MTNDGGPAFPKYFGGNRDLAPGESAGMSLRDYFAAHAPEPIKERVIEVMEMEKLRNPHNEPHKPARRGFADIAVALRWEWADRMLKAREEPR